MAHATGSGGDRDPVVIYGGAVEPVEINAGGWYLRALRADERIDDRPALVAAFTDPELLRWVPHYSVTTVHDAGGYVALRARQWADGSRCSWAVAEPTTGALVGEVGLQHVDRHWQGADVGCWAAPAVRGRGVLTAVLPAVLRWAFAPVELGGLGLHRVGYRHAAGNAASERLARRCGFRLDGHLRDAALVDGERRDLRAWSRLATD